MKRPKRPMELLEKLNLNMLPENFEENLDFLLKKCVSETYEYCFKRYFYDGLTLEEISKEVGTTRERIRQFISKTCHKLETADCKSILVSEISHKAINSPDYKQELGLKSSVADLDLSTRSFICLYRAGIYRIEDLINLDLNQLQHVRNMDKKSLKEIVEKLNKNGFYLNVIS